MIEKIAGGWSGGPAVAGDRTVLDLLADVVRENGDAVAVIAAGESLTYAQLQDKATSAAAGLRERGIGRGDVVALHMTRGCAAVVAALAVLHAGATYLALDPLLPLGRLRMLVDDALPALVVTDGEFDAGVPSCRLEDLSAEARLSAPAPADVAYLIYTSGSTGRPKGVLVRHDGLANVAVAGARGFGLANGKRMLQVASWSFDAAVWEIFMALTSGATLVVADVEELDTVLTNGSVDAALLTPTVASWLPADRPITLEALGFGGERCGAELVRRFASVPTLLNCYGPTEASVCVAIHRCDPSDTTPPVGPPLPGVRAYVLDEQGNPARSGELYLGGTAVAAGYLNRDEQNRRAFLADPFAEGARMYRTGDLAEVAPDGVITVHGRADAQVKIRGVRIELGEVEAAIAAQPGVTQCGAEVVDGRLVAAIVPPGVDGDAIRLRCKEILHPAMVPAAVVALDGLPLLPSGKLDRPRLREVIAASASTVERKVDVEWTDDVERVVAEMFTELCGAAPSSRDDDLLSLGGHSLTAARISARLRQRFGVVVPMSAILRESTVPAVAAAVRHRQATPLHLPERSEPVSGDKELSFGEERLWFLWTVEPRSSAYCVPIDVTLSGPLDVARLRQRTAEVLARHELLRSRYVRNPDGVPMRRADGAPPQVGHVDLSDASDPRRASDEWVAQAAREPFDLEHGPLVRATVLRLADDEHRLVLCLHHIVCDGWSNVVLVEQIIAAHTGREPVEPAATYQDFVRWQRDQLTSGRIDELSAFWRDYLGSAPTALTLPASGIRADATSTPAGSLRITVPAATTGRLQELAARHGATTFHVLLTALTSQLFRLTGQQDVVVGSIVGDRPLPELESVVGFFVDTVPIRATFGADLTVGQTIAAVRTSALTALEHAELPFDHVVRAVDPPRVPGMNPVVQVALNVLNTPDVEGGIPGVRTGIRFETGPESKFDLAVYAEPGARELGLHWVYRTDLFDADSVRELAEQYVAVLEQFLDDTRPLGELRLDSEARRELAAESAEPPAVCDVSSATASFRRAVAADPDRIAVRWHGDLTYRELAERVDELRRGLADSWLDQTTSVVIAARRTPDLPVAVLALLEHGVPFAVVDAALPEAAFAAHLETLRPAAVLTGLSLRLCDGGVPVRPGVAYLAHTSGTTGRPKVVLGTRASLDRHVGWETSTFGITTADRFAMLSGLMYDPCLRDILVPLANGATLCIPEDDFGADGHALSDWLRRARVTVWHTTPGLLGAATAGANGAVDDLRLIMSGGDRLHGADVARATQVFPRAHVVNVYGTTETPQVMSAQDATGESPGVVALGVGTPTSRLLVLDDRSRLAGTGEVGEIVVQSHYLSLGYRDEQNDSAFAAAGVVAGEIAGPFYRTGDLGWRDAAGDVHLIGRRDHQLKIGGVRVEPGHLEHVLSQHDQVVAVAVRATPRLTAFVVSSVDTDELRRHAERHLPAGLVPEIVAVSELCYNRNGKLDVERTAERAVGTGVHEETSEPETEIEQRLAGLWSEILQKPVVTPAADFFRLGGHSLLVTRMLAAVRAEFGVDVGFRDFFTAPTVRRLAHLVEAELMSDLDEAELALLDDDMFTNDAWGPRP
ncbi:amino acid adenylation domain-containing protein [Streptomyces sp. ID05-26A]|nr:amino acid adenylation domain-containing protein [Streptomyces sp. ID05-26A]